VPFLVNARVEISLLTSTGRTTILVDVRSNNEDMDNSVLAATKSFAFRIFHGIERHGASLVQQACHNPHDFNIFEASPRGLRSCEPQACCSPIRAHGRILRDQILMDHMMIDQGEGRVPPKRSRFPLWELAILVLTVSLSTGAALAQSVRGTVIHEETIRVSPGADTAKLGEAGRGYEIVVLDSTPDWTHVEALLIEPHKDGEEEDSDFGAGKTITGWILSKALVSTTTQDGDKIIFGEAVNSEDEASRRRGRRDAAQDAMRLYYRIYDLFPASPLAAEALFRAADIRWQMERNDVMTRPSAREREAYMRGQIDEQWMKLVMKKYPGTKWADLAAYRLIENKLCGDWQGASKCPEKESELYEKFAKEHEQSTAAPEALYDAASRQAALIEIYKTEANQKKSEAAKSRALELAEKVASQYPQTEWALRAKTLIYYIQQGVPTYGNASD
jgi:outer membrane protein assembly factor BamD (BamD/ComL family)